MRASIREFVQIVAETLPVGEPVYEFGSLQVPGQEGFGDLRPLFAGREYMGCDMREGPGVDKVLDLHGIDLPDATAGTVLVLDTLEHVEFVRKAVEECKRILKPGGILVISSVMKFHIHDYPHDYWRFTPQAFRSLLKPFGYSMVYSAGKEIFPHTVVGVGFKEQAPRIDPATFERRMAQWQRKWRRTDKYRKAIIKLFTRPGEISFIQQIRGIRI